MARCLTAVRLFLGVWGGFFNLFFLFHFIHVICSAVEYEEFPPSARANQNTVYCLAACVFDVKRGERSASVPMETVCVR